MSKTQRQRHCSPLIETVWAQPERYRAAISDQQAGDGTEKIIELIDAVTGEKA